MMKGGFHMSVHKDKLTGKWFFTVRHEGKQMKFRGFVTKRDAMAAQNSFIENPSRSNSSSKVKFNDCYVHYMEHAKSRLKVRTIYSNAKMIEKHILPYFSERPISNITPADIDAWKLEMDRFSHEYKAKMLSILKSIFYFAELHYEVRNPARKTTNFKDQDLPTKKNDYYTFSEFKKFIEVAKNENYDFYVFFSFLYFTGLRRGEAQALTWNEIDFNRGEIKIHKNYSSANGDGSKLITTPKTKTSNRTVLMNESLILLMKNYKKVCSKYDNFNDDVFVFGIVQPHSNTTIARKNKLFAAKAGVKQIRIHDFRHSHASLLINSGADAFIVAKRLGHSVKMVHETYAHLFPNEQKKILHLIDNILLT